MYCASCGAEISEKANFCGACGQAMSAPSSVQAEATAHHHTRSSEVASPGDKTARPGGCVNFALSLLVAAFASCGLALFCAFVAHQFDVLSVLDDQMKIVLQAMTVLMVLLAGKFAFMLTRDSGLGRWSWKATPGSSPPDSSQAAETNPHGKSSFWRVVIGIMFNPVSLLQPHLEKTHWVRSLFIPAIAFGILFLQGALDMAKAGAVEFSEVPLYLILGLVYGSLGLFLVAGLAWGIASRFGTSWTLEFTARAFALSYCPALLYGFLGLLANVLLGWNTAVTFGVTGVLWAFCPMIVVLRSMTEERLELSVGLATLCGGLLLFGWGVLGT